ncbi:hypothetical protein [Alicycliphilus denitrificans]|uniref:hypothetical protein n=1 Tax=Alicycliphilus denitrificans TaxID=179636 RepID=UPI00384F7248
MPKSALPDDELRTLDRLAQFTIAYLLLASLASFLAGAHALNSPALPALLAPVLIGFCGSAIAALTSCLDRYATGFERENGEPYPEKATGGKFNRRFSRWLFIRPFLGAVVAPVFIWGLSHFTQSPQEFQSSPETLGFTAFTAGLLAKSVLDLVKNLFKNVFKA